ncbi:hypothetical protein RA086_05770 [Lactiplantibacillus sp. WILCCON 0030]|uniref:Uncharacterized protein n=1 Tax=Lactiplantibacillus brownii TaxID=3069269 RepID=A0ABU1A873_9LACO|nr:hypothetical protein [Lactiplantibacillus brownii]MDQ7937135.1 hypothetical protein [Lactiplantibacillus brownii]
MFLTTGDLQRSHMIKSVVSATEHLMFESDGIDQFERFDGLIDKVKQDLMAKAEAQDGDGLIYVNFNTEIAQMSVAPRFLVVTGYGTVVKLAE